jgi:translation initiation factor 5
MKKFDGVNVPRRNDDPFYRYKMPVIKVRVEGRGKMVKTTLENIEDVAKSIERPTDFLMKYFAFELGVQYAVKNDKHTLGSARSADELADLLDIFIDKFILCGSCNNPETMFQCKKTS